MSKTVSVALWIASTVAIIVLAVGILWPMIRELLDEADDTRPGEILTSMIEQHFEYDEQPVGVYYELV